MEYQVSKYSLVSKFNQALGQDFTMVIVMSLKGFIRNWQTPSQNLDGKIYNFLFITDYCFSLTSVVNLLSFMVKDRRFYYWGDQNDFWGTKMTFKGPK